MVLESRTGWIQDKLVPGRSKAAEEIQNIMTGWEGDLDDLMDGYLATFQQ